VLASWRGGVVYGFHDGTNYDGTDHQDASRGTRGNDVIWRRGDL
jgi:hypothetical protein